MIKVALKGLAGRKVRALLTALAVVIGVSMVSGTFVLTDTMQKAFDGIFEESYEGTDAVISGGAVPASMLEKVKALPSVETAAGSIQDLQENTNPATLLDKNGEMIGRQGESMGIGVGDDGRQFTPLKLKQGGWAHGAKQVVHRRRHGAQVRLRRRRHDQDRAATGPRRTTRSRASPRSARSTTSAARRWRSSTSRPPRRCSTRPGSSTTSPSRPRTAARRAPSPRTSSRC